jgi:hypothetical protein
MTTVEIELETLRALFDLVVGSMNYGSGFYDEDDVKIILKVAEQIGAIDGLEIPDRSDRSKRFRLTKPHLWHQECKLPWRCGKAANDPIHRPELPK